MEKVYTASAKKRKARRYARKRAKYANDYVYGYKNWRKLSRFGFKSKYRNS